VVDLGVAVNIATVLLMVQPDPASTCYLKAYPEPAGRSRVKALPELVLALDRPRVRGIIYNQVEADQRSGCHLTILHCYAAKEKGVQSGNERIYW